MDPKRRLFLRQGGRLATEVAAPVAPHRPPWASPDESTFTQTCTRCEACVQACPRQLLSRGDGGFPEIHFDQQGCNFCGACWQACTVGALQRLPTSTRSAFGWQVQAVGGSCLSHRQVECRVCGEACDTRALRFVPAPGGVSRLLLNPQACTGCGECLGRCPVQALRLDPCCAPAAATGAEETPVPPQF